MFESLKITLCILSIPFWENPSPIVAQKRQGHDLATARESQPPPDCWQAIYWQLTLLVFNFAKKKLARKKKYSPSKNNQAVLSTHDLIVDYSTHFY
jgi:hypothetical protein